MTSFKIIDLNECYFLQNRRTDKQDKTGFDISEDVSGIFGILGSLLTCIFFTLRYREWSKFFNDVSDTSKYGKPADFDAVIKRGNLVSSINVWYANIGILIYAAVSMTETSYCKRMNENEGLHEICGSFVPLWLPFEADRWMVMVIFMGQLALGYYLIPPSAVICFLPWESAEVLISHINHLKSNFVKIFTEHTFEGRRDRLIFCIRYHVHILRMSDQLNVLVKYTVGHISLIAAIIFGCIENQIFKAKPLGAIIYLLAYMVALFWLCHGGQRITDQTLEIGDIFYEANWYKAEVTIIKDLRFIIARCQKPICLDALPLGTLNYALFLMILKTSYSYLTLLNQTL